VNTFYSFSTLLTKILLDKTQKGKIYLVTVRSVLFALNLMWEYDVITKENMEPVRHTTGGRIGTPLNLISETNSEFRDRSGQLFQLPASERELLAVFIVVAIHYVRTC